MVSSPDSQPVEQVPYYDYALDIILDVETPQDELLTEDQQELVPNPPHTCIRQSRPDYIYKTVTARIWPWLSGKSP